jgi:hypothetical protein
MTAAPSRFLSPNPPYFSHYDIAERFIQTARRQVGAWRGARISSYKNAAGHEHLMRRAFGNAEIIRRARLPGGEVVMRPEIYHRSRRQFYLAPRPPQEPMSSVHA